MSRIYFFTKYTSLGSSSRYRTLQYLPHLPQDCLFSVKPLFDDDYLNSLYKTGSKPLLKALIAYLKRLVTLLMVEPKSTIVLENELWPYLPFFFEKLFLTRFKKVVLIYDDAIFNNYLSSNNLYLKLNKNKIGKLMNLASVTIVGNKFIEKYAQSFGAKTCLIPTVIDIAKYPEKQTYNTSINKLKLVWIGSPSTAYYLEHLSEVFEDPWVQENCNLTIIGVSQENSLQLGNIEVQYKSWSEESEVANMQNCDIGIMPLLDDQWSKGKCGFKLIQYMAAGLPCLASPVGANCEIVLNGLTGYLPSSKEDWVESLKKMHQNQNSIELYGRVGRKRAEELYTIDATKDKWLQCIKN